MSLKGPVSNQVASDFITLSGTYFYLGSSLRMDFSGSDAFTVEGWVGFTSLESAAPLFAKAGELILGLTDNGNVFVRRHFWEDPLISARPLEAGLWHHVAVTCDERAWTLYVNGNESGQLGDAAMNETPRNVGTLKRDANLSCEIWNLRVWNVARTRAQILREMTSLVVPQSGLVASFFPELPAATHLRLGHDELASSAA